MDDAGEDDEDFDDHDSDNGSRAGAGSEPFGEQNDWNALGGHEYSRELGDISNRFQDWAEQNLFDKATGGDNDQLESAQFRLRTGNEKGFNLGSDVGKSDDLVGSLENLFEGKFDQISERGMARVDAFLDTVSDLITGPDRPGGEPGVQTEAGAEGTKTLVSLALNYALNSMGIETTTEQWKEREIERAEAAERWTQIHSGWWRSERDDSDWRRSDSTRVRDQGPEQTFP